MNGGRKGKGRGGKRINIYNRKFDEQIDGVIHDIKLENMKFNRPNIYELEKINKLIKQFIVKKGLKLYGGHAINHFMPEGKKIYDGTSIDDYDIYCKDAEKDGKDMADVLYKAGVEYVSLSVGAFGDNRKLFCSFAEVANFTTLPKKLFDAIPVVADKKSGVSYVEPDYLKMDLRVSIVNPRISLWRWIKDYGRMQILEKEYPFKKPANCKWPVMDAVDKKDLAELVEVIKDWRSETVLVGWCALSAYIKESGMSKVIGAPSGVGVEIMSVKIKEIIDEIMKRFGNKRFVYRVEEDPLHILPKKFVVAGRKSGKELLVIYSLLEHCVPWVKMGGVRVVSADYLILYMQVQMYTVGMIGSKTDVLLYRCGLYGFDKMREKWLGDKGKDVFDKTLYQMHIIDCYGQFVNPYYKTLIDKWERKGTTKKTTRLPTKLLKND